MLGNDHIRFSRHGSRAHILLCRPQALNAVTRDMLLRLEERLEAWKKDDSVSVVTIRGAGDRAFAAGGDIRALYEAGRIDGSRNFPFYADEYRVNTRIKRYPKPFVAFMDGIVMGGGVGLSVHGSHRVVGDRTVFAMPETGIGLFPDVGGGYFLPRLPGHVGMYLGLTGARIKAADCLYAGLADTFVPSEATDDAISTLDSIIWTGDREPADLEVQRRLSKFHGQPGCPLLPDFQSSIDTCFGAETIKEALHRLGATGDDGWRMTQANILAAKSPTSLCVAFRQIRQGTAMEFESCMRMEYHLVKAFMIGHDFYEGVRATIIDKDGQPDWRPATLAEVSDDALDAMFDSSSDGDLQL